MVSKAILIIGGIAAAGVLYILARKTQETQGTTGGSVNAPPIGMPTLEVTLSSPIDWSLVTTGLTPNGHITLYTIYLPSNSVSGQQSGTADPTGAYANYGTASPGTYAVYVEDNTTGAITATHNI